MKYKKDKFTMDTLKDMGYVEGRVYKGIDKPNYSGVGITLQQLKELKPQDIVGKPLYYEHDYEKQKIGSITKYWLDDENWLNIGAYIFNDTDFRKDILNKIRQGDLRSFSIGYLVPLPDSNVDLSERKIIETSVTSDPQIPGSNMLLCYSKNKKKKENKSRDIPFDKESRLFLKIQNSKMSSENQVVEQSENNPQQGNDEENVTMEDVFDVPGMIQGKNQEDIVKMMTASVKNGTKMQKRIQELEAQQAQWEEQYKSQYSEKLKELEELRKYREEQDKLYIQEKMPVFEETKQTLVGLGLMKEDDEEGSELLKKIITDPKGNGVANLITGPTLSYAKIAQENQELKKENEKFKGFFNGMKAGNNLPAHQYNRYANDFVAVQNNKRHYQDFVANFFKDEDEDEYTDEQTALEPPKKQQRLVQNSKSVAVKNERIEKIKPFIPSSSKLSNSLMAKDPELFNSILSHKFDS